MNAMKLIDTSFFILPQPTILNRLKERLEVEFFDVHEDSTFVCESIRSNR